MTTHRQWLIAVFTALAVLPGQLIAGGHTASPTEKQPVVLDPEARSDITGTVLVSGANRGIGLRLARNYAERGWTVIATARKPDKADELNELANANSRVSVERMDLLDHGSIDALAEKYKDVPIDVLLNNAAILGDPAGQNVGSFDYELMERVLDVNTIGTMKMAEAFLGSVAASEQKKIVAVTSQQASIGALRDPLIPFYKMSKTALNMGMKSISTRLKRKKITIVLISPGAVDTEMMNTALDYAGAKGGFLITPEQSAEAVINIIDQYGFDMSGTFMSHRGDEIPW